MVLSLAGILYVPVDIAVSRSGYDPENATRIWECIVMLQLIYVWILGPILLVFYESNENDEFVKRVFRAVKVQLPMIFALLALTIPTYFWVNEVRIPQGVADELGLQTNGVDDDG